MAIRVMVGEEKAGRPNVETVTNYSGHEAGRIRHGEACPHHGEYDLSGEHSPECVLRSGEYGVDTNGVKRGYRDFCEAPMKPLFMETTYVGKVVYTGEHNGYDDSDFYAYVREDDGSFRKIVYASTRGWTYPNGASVDASPEDINAFYAWQSEVTELAAKARREAAAAEAKARGEHVGRGDHVKVVKGRKVPKGTEGEVFWVGKCKFSGRPRIGFNGFDGETYWTAASNVEVVEADSAAA
jgi:hypothetical protein